MILGYHGGQCCGIKTIYEMTYSPVGIEGALAPHKNKTSYDLSPSLEVPHRFNIYWEGAPKETGLERLDRYLDYLKKWRPKGLVEIVLSSYQDVWVKYLEERGFVATTKFKNSNTSNNVAVYHLTMDEEVHQSDDDDWDDDDCDDDDYDYDYDNCDCEYCRVSALTR